MPPKCFAMHLRSLQFCTCFCCHWWVIENWKLKMSVHMNDLLMNIIILENIFEFLGNKRLFIIEIVCKKWQDCVRDVLATRDTLHWRDYYGSAFQLKGKYVGKKKGKINDNNVRLLENILSKYSNIKHLHLAHTITYYVWWL